MRRLLTIKGAIALAAFVALMATAGLYANHRFFEVNVNASVNLVVSGDAIQVLSGDGVTPIHSGDSLDFGTAAVDFFGRGPVPVKGPFVIKNVSNGPVRVEVTGDLRDGIVPLFGPTRTDLKPAQDNAFTLAAPGSTGDTMMGYLGLRFRDLEAGQKGTTIIFRATEAPEEPARIAFSSLRDGDNFEIYVMDANGANQTRLTRGNSDNLWPDWSPQGDKIVFSSQEGTGDADIYVMNAGGSNQKRLTIGTADDESPAWSNKGDKIAFDSGATDTGDLDIYVMDADGSNPTALTNTGLNGTPAWSPDDAKIAFASSGDGNLDVYVMNADGSDQKRLTFDTGDDFSPRWSPDGTKITFNSSKDDALQIYVMNADGSDRTSLTPSSALDLAGC